MKKLEYWIEWGVFQSRWLQVPVYLGMCVIMALYSYVFVKEVAHTVIHAEELTENTMLMIAIGCIDISMVLNLMIVCIIGGYWSFVSHMDVIENNKDRLQFDYLGRINANTLKYKLLISLISISAVHLLESFVSENVNLQRTILQIAIHLVFVFSALAITYMDKMGQGDH